MNARMPILKPPPGATDTHMHVYRAGAAIAEGAPPVPGEFTEEQYRQVRERLGLERVVVVQPTAYGTDNGVTLRAIRQLGDARGVGVVDVGVSEPELDELTRGGIVALRVFSLGGAVVSFANMAEVMQRVHGFGWHANIQLDGRDLPDREDSIRRLPGNFVIDHIGKFLEPVSTDDEAFRCLLRLIDTGRCWVKLSAPYETSRTGPPDYADVARLAKELVRHAPERMLWASNWPHPAAPDSQKPDDADLLDLMLDWAPSEAARKRILVDNARELYGFRD